MKIRRVQRTPRRRAMAACVGASIMIFAPLGSAQQDADNDATPQVVIEAVDADVDGNEPALDDAQTPTEAALKDAAEAATRDASGPYEEMVRSAHALRDALLQTAVPDAERIALTSTKDLTERMVDAEVRFDLEEWVHCASLLAPMLPELRAQNHPAYERAAYLFAESLFQSQSYALARTAFEEILDANHPTYRKDAMMRLVEIELKVGSREGLDARYNALLQNYGNANDGDASYLLARTQYVRKQYEDAIEGFSRLPADSPLYWRAQYHGGVAMARAGRIDDALERFEFIEESLQNDAGLSDADAQVLQYARLGQGVAHYEHEAWERAAESYARVLPGSDAYPQALYQQAWSEVRQENIDEAIAHLEVLEVMSDDTALISEARLLSADLLRHERAYNDALNAYGRASDDLELVRLELADIRAREDDSVPTRVDATAEILTGSMLASFDAEHWFPDDPIAQRGLELLRASETLETWLDGNQDIADEIQDALESGYAYDRVHSLRTARAAFVEAEYQRAAWWGELAQDGREQRGSNDKTRATLHAQRAFDALPVHALEDSVERVRGIYEDTELRLFKEEETLRAEVDAIDARREHLRQQIQLQKISPERVSQERQQLETNRAELNEAIQALYDARTKVQRQRIRYGLGEAQSAVLERSRAYREAAQAELQELGVDVDRAASALESLGETIEQGLQRLDARVKDAWEQAYAELGREQEDVDRLVAEHATFDATTLQDARTAAMDGFLAMLGNVKSVALRASLGEVDVAWWQKEDVSQRIDALFKEQERQIQRLDAGFSELRE